MAEPGSHRNSDSLCALISRHRVTTLHFVPSMLQAFLEHDDLEGCASLADIFCSGEALAAALVRQCRQRLGSARLHNLYGPTEAAIDVTAWTCPPGPLMEGLIPLGRPIANTRIYILDRSVSAGTASGWRGRSILAGPGWRGGI